MNKIAYLQQLLSSYESFFDIEENVTLDGRSYPATATFHSRSEKYILVKAAKLWAMEMNEYAFFSLADTLTLQDFLALKEDALQAGLAQIKPHSEHMYSYVSLVIIAEGIDGDAMQAIKKTKYHKTFLFSLQGWMDLRIAVLDINTGKIYSNAKGRDLISSLEQALKQSA